MDLLPFLEQQALHGQLDRTLAWDADANRGPALTALPVLRCPDWDREMPQAPPNVTPYIGIAGVGKGAATLPAGHPAAGAFGYDRRLLLADLKDGAANTLVILESTRENGPWAQGGPATVRGLDPADAPYLGTGRPFGGTHFTENSVAGHGTSNGAHALMADGSVRFLRNDAAAPRVLEALATVAGGEAVEAP